MHTPCLPLFLGLRWGLPQLYPKNLKKVIQLYYNPENFSSLLCNPRATDLYTQTIPFLHTDPAVI